MEAALVTTLRELFAQRKTPSHDDKEAAAQAIASLIEQAQTIGHAYASNEQQRSFAWGGKFINALNSAWAIVSNFVQRIGDWISGQETDGVDVSEEDIIAEVDTLAERVGGFEIAAAIEEQVIRELTFAGVKMARSIAQPGACEPCRDKASAGSVPIDDFEPPPYHSRCRCSATPADEGD